MRDALGTVRCASHDRMRVKGEDTGAQTMKVAPALDNLEKVLVAGRNAEPSSEWDSYWAHNTRVGLIQIERDAPDYLRGQL